MHLNKHLSDIWRKKYPDILNSNVCGVCNTFVFDFQNFPKLEIAGSKENFHLRFSILMADVSLQSQPVFAESIVKCYSIEGLSYMIFEMERYVTVSEMTFVLFKGILWSFIYTSTKSWRGYIFTPVCLCVCLSFCLCVQISCEQNSSRTDEPIWTRFSLNSCLPQWLKPYWNWGPWVKGQGHSDVIPILFS